MIGEETATKNRSGNRQEPKLMMRRDPTPIMKPAIEPRAFVTGEEQKRQGEGGGDQKHPAMVYGAENKQVKEPPSRIHDRA